MAKSYLDKWKLARITDRIANNYIDENGIDISCLKVDDMNELVNFADCILNELEIQYRYPSAAASEDYPDEPEEDIETLMGHLDPDETATVTCYYAGPSRTYRNAPTDGDGNLCEKCGGKFCGDWAGEDCPSKKIEPVILP